MPPGSAALVLVRALAWHALAWHALAWHALAWHALAWRGLVGGVARWHGAARADRSAGSHGLPWHAFAGKASSRGGAASRGWAASRGKPASRRRPESRGGPRAPAAGAREAASLGPASTPRGVACGHGAAWGAAAGRRRHKARGRDRPDSCRAGNRDEAAWLRPGRATAGPGSTRRPALPGPALPGPAAVRRSAGFPGWPGLLASRARDHPWACRAGRPVSTHSSGSAWTADRNALRHNRYLHPGHQRGAGPGGAPAMYQAPVTCHARGTPP